MVIYVIHYEILKLYERLGLKITKIHKAIKFEESDWLRKYIDLNIMQRTKAKNNFEKDFFKLMNNSVFGKTMENIENRVDIRLKTNKERAKKLAAKPNYEHCKHSIFWHPKLNPEIRLGDVETITDPRLQESIHCVPKKHVTTFFMIS